MDTKLFTVIVMTFSAFWFARDLFEFMNGEEPEEMSATFLLVSHAAYCLAIFFWAIIILNPPGK